MKNLVLGALALGFGVYFGVCEVVGTVDFLKAQQGQWNYIVWAGVGIAAVLSLLPAFASIAWQVNRVSFSVVLWVMFVVCLGSVVTAAVSRTGGAVDQAQADRDDTETKRARAVKEVEEAKTELRKTDADLAAARNKAADTSKDKGCAENCATVLKAAIASAEQSKAAAQGRLDNAKDALNAFPPPATDALASRAEDSGLLSAENVRRYQPIVVPAITSVLSAILLALGVHCLAIYAHEHHERKIMEAAAEADLADNVTDVEASPPSAPPLALQFKGPGAELATFASNRIIRADGNELSMRDVLVDYETFCSRQPDMQPLDRLAFVKELAALCRTTGIPVRVEGKDAFLIGAALAA